MCLSYNETLAYNNQGENNLLAEILSHAMFTQYSKFHIKQPASWDTRYAEGNSKLICKLHIAFNIVKYIMGIIAYKNHQCSYYVQSLKNKSIKLLQK